MSADVVDKLDLGTHRLSTVEDLCCDGTDSSFHRADHTSLELRRNRSSVGRVARRIHGQQHVSHLRKAGRVEVFDDHASFVGREDLRVFGDVHYVGVAQDRPITGFVLHLLKYDRLFTT